jgi:putative ABC transport system permease protein
MTTPEQAERFYATLSERIAALPGVTSASVSTGMPIGGVSFRRPFELADARAADPNARRWTGVNMVTPSYHWTFGIPIRRGRTFTDMDRSGSRPVAIVNEAFVRQFVGAREAVGLRLLIAPVTFEPPATAPPATAPPSPVEWEVVGVQADAANAGPGREAQPEVVLPFAQHPWPRAIVALKTSAGLAAPQAAIAGVLQSIDPTLPMVNVQTIDQTLRESTAADRFYTLFFAAFAGVALLLAAVGIYGVMSFAVAQRTHEIGLRMALGGNTTQVLTQVLREGMTTAVAGTAVGAIGAMLVGRVMKGTIFGVEPANPLTLVLVAVTLLLAAFVACIVPARRAALVDPMVALRQE